MFDSRHDIFATLGSLSMLRSVARALLPPSLSPKRPYDVAVTSNEEAMDDFLAEAKRLFESPLQHAALLEASARFHDAYKQKMHETAAPCMLPSYNHTLPTGEERGTYLALDVGGSTFRVALVQLNGKDMGEESMKILRMISYRIDEPVRGLKGNAFFDWMAERIMWTVEHPVVKAHCGSDTLPMGLAWSFPIYQTSERGGKLAEMGKGFEATHGVEGMDLGELIMVHCRQRHLNVRLAGIVNDGAATLLTRAYRDTATRLALILGTGTNAAIHLPVGALASEKYGQRPQSWHDEAEHVLVNTEMSMFGKGILPTTRWDDELNNALPDKWKDFQPLEMMISGRNMAEIMRLTIIEAIDKFGLFGGSTPGGMRTAYNFDCSLMATLEAHDSPGLAESLDAWQNAHPLPSTQPYTLRYLSYLRKISLLISNRAAAFLAVGIHSLWSLRLAEEGLSPTDEDHVTIGCNGSVIEKYPGFRERTVRYLDELCVSTGGHKGSIRLEIAWESAIFGAAICVSCLDRKDGKSQPGVDLIPNNKLES